ncbi:hypothetical protein DUNSADRAFT_12443 [Dunaliella salina]|uniref:Uncharacterized protein n=1 Tax=Dunaliella salina TaxID=3046 RepID=A0ABQ7H3S2_DUNSA|nr:hypothetical protein DUNSADRAFT_12443 [Dunaliella salina]|eukprot:KAF5841515.1 hypothetical protein DUNSADRAFT_12443 [Dunaliella salina]
MISSGWKSKPTLGNCSSPANGRLTSLTFSLRFLEDRKHALRAVQVQEEVLSQQKKQWRPSKDDVDRISWGGFARVRGTGSRDIPHRLNASERPLYEGAKKKGFLAVRGTGYRRERKGTPLPNIYRQWCDANSSVTIVIEQNMFGREQDTVVVDLSTLRLPQQELEVARSLAVQLCEGMEGVSLDTERAPEDVPFNILPLGTLRPRSNKLSGGPAAAAEDDEAEADGAGTDASESKGHEHEQQGGSSSEHVGEEDTVSGSSAAQVQMRRENEGLDPPSSAPGGYKNSITWELKQTSDSAASLLEKLKEKVIEAADHTRKLKEQQGMKNQDPAVRQSVEQLLQLKADVEAAELEVEAEKRRANPSARMSALYSAFSDIQMPEAKESVPAVAHANSTEELSGSIQSSPGLSEREHRARERRKIVATWQMMAVPVFFVGSRSAAKGCAAALSEHLKMSRILAEAAKVAQKTS